jgi:hypothetical protein
MKILKFTVLGQLVKPDPFDMKNCGGSLKVLEKPIENDMYKSKKPVALFLRYLK